MRTMYTTKPDEGCREVEKGIFGRPVQTSEQSKMRKLGWGFTIDSQRGTSGVREEKEGREEAKGKVRKAEADKWAESGKEFYDEEGEVKDFDTVAAAIMEDANDRHLEAGKNIGENYWREAYKQRFGKKPHHKMKLETIKAKLDEALRDD